MPVLRQAFSVACNHKATDIPTQMLNIDLEIFRRNLLSTQIYCEQQLTNTDKNCASILRSINPDNEGEKMFKFSLYEVAVPNPFYTFGTTWKLDPINTPNIIEELFKKQIKIKQTKYYEAKNRKTFKGNILAFKVDETLVDGAASVSTNGLLDDFNCPPIDTWLYLTQEDNIRILLAWIPIQFVNFVNNGICVNPENCIDWFKVSYPADFTKLMEE